MFNRIQHMCWDIWWFYELFFQRSILGNKNFWMVVTRGDTIFFVLCSVVVFWNSLSFVCSRYSFVVGSIWFVFFFHSILCCYILLKFFVCRCFFFRTVCLSIFVQALFMSLSLNLVYTRTGGWKNVANHKKNWSTPDSLILCLFWCV